MDARGMQIEFERRITLMNPGFELTEKLTSDTIFSFLNAYVERYVRTIYLQDDATVTGTRAQKKNQDAMKGLITRALLNLEEKDANDTDKVSDRAILPDDYFLYIRSNSVISKNYKLEDEITDADEYVVTPNKVIKEEDAARVISTYYNKAILLNPYVVLNNGNDADTQRELYINIIHDEYTIVKNVDLVYYRRPKKFNVIGVDGVNVLNYCELPENVHMEIVEGAVEMFITEAKYRLNIGQNSRSKQNEQS